MFEVTVTAQVAFTRIDGGGTRRVRLADGTVHEFSRYPKRLEELPPEVAADPYLVTREVDAETPPETGSETPGTKKKGDRVQISASPAPLSALALIAGPALVVEGGQIIGVDFAKLEYPALVKFAKDLQFNPFGKKKDELREALAAHIAANYVADPATPAVIEEP